MALAVKLSLAVLMCASIALAYGGPPPRRRAHTRLRGGLLSCALIGYAGGALVLADGALVPGALALALAGELMCAAGWLSRGEAPPTDEDDDSGGGGGRGPKPPPSDWDAFERAFRRHVRERDRQPV